MLKQHLTLRPADQEYLLTLTRRGRTAARSLKRANALLALHDGQSIEAVAASLHTSRQSITRWRDQYRSSGLQVLDDRPRSGRPLRIDGTQRAQVTALACSTPPEGRARWTLRLLADKAVELGFCSSLSHTQTRKILKKTNSNRT